MAAFGSAVAFAPRASDAAREAARSAREALGGAPPVLAVAFTSAGPADVDAIPRAVEEELRGVPVVGGTAAGAVFDTGRVGGTEVNAGGGGAVAVMVALIGGDDVRATVVSEPMTSAQLLELVPTAERIARAADAVAPEGHTELTCLAFAPAGVVDGEAFAAALRKGSGARAQLAGGLLGASAVDGAEGSTRERARVFDQGTAREDRIVLAGLFTRAPLGVAARHGWQAVGPARTITGIDGAWLLSLDHRRALDVWREDARAASATRGGFGNDGAQYRVLGVVDRPSSPRLATTEPIVRGLLEVRADGAVRLSAPLAEQARVRVMHGSPRELLDAAREAARVARAGAGGDVAGALVFASMPRVAPYEDDFGREPRAIADVTHGPVAGACVLGEIARAHRDLDAFHNTATVVVALPR